MIHVSFLGDALRGADTRNGADFNSTAKTAAELALFGLGNRC